MQEIKNLVKWSFIMTSVTLVLFFGIFKLILAGIPGTHETIYLVQAGGLASAALVVLNCIIGAGFVCLLGVEFITMVGVTATTVISALTATIIGFLYASIITSFSVFIIAGVVVTLIIYKTYTAVLGLTSNALDKMSERSNIDKKILITVLAIMSKIIIVTMFACMFL